MDFKNQCLLFHFFFKSLVGYMPGPLFERNDDQPNINDLITFAEAARLSGFTDRHIRKLAYQNELWAVRLGRNWFTTAQAVKAYLAKNRKPGPKPKKGG